MTSVLENTADELASLDSQEAVKVFRRILWAEGRRVGIPKSKIVISDRVNVADGGIDASVDQDVDASKSEFLSQGKNGFQIKASSTFSPWQASEVKNELFGTKEIKKENLKKAIKDCLDQDGTYTLVCFRQDFVGTQQSEAKNELEKAFKDCGYDNPKVQVLGTNQLIGILSNFPSLVLALKRLNDEPLQTYRDWGQDESVSGPYFPAPDYSEKCNAIQETLDSQTTSHIRVIAEAGSGKTRFVFEVLKPERFESLVIFTTADQFIGNRLYNQMIRADNSSTGIFVIDECSLAQANEIWNKFKNRGQGIKIITIYNIPEPKEHGILYYDPPILSEDEIAKIIGSYLEDTHHISRWVPFAEHSPWFAHLIGKNLKNNPDDVLRPVGDIINRIIGGTEAPDSVAVKKRRRVLRTLALFKRFGVKAPFQEEIASIRKLAMESSSDISTAEFDEIIKFLREMKILQGDSTYYITPRALHIMLWKEWWDTHGDSFDHDVFIKKLPENTKLRDWFYEMIKYAGESVPALAIVQWLLGPEGPFRQTPSLLETESGANFFLALAEADPKSALSLLEIWIRGKNKDSLLNFKEGRREIVWALEKIAVWRDYFIGASKILLALGEAENEEYSNNASGVFADLFSTGYGLVAPTEAPPLERFPILQETFRSPSKDVRLLGIKAAEKALESGHFSRTVGPEYQGLKRIPNLWRPATYGEIFDSYRRAWSLLKDSLTSLPNDEKNKAVKVLLDSSRGLGNIENLTEMIVSDLKGIAGLSEEYRKAVLKTVITILRFDGKDMPETMRNKWEALKESLTGNSFQDLLRRYAGMDVTEEQLDYLEGRDHQAQSHIESLVDQSIGNKSLLENELSWLVTGQAENGFRFGHELSKKDLASDFLNKIIRSLETAESPGGYFFGGYLKGIFERDKEQWESILDQVSTIPPIRALIPELTWRSGMTDRAALRILNLVKTGLVPPESLSYFRYGGVVRSLSEDVCIKIIEHLLSLPSKDCLIIGMEIFNFYYLYRNPNPTFPRSLAVKILTHPSLITEGTARFREQSLEVEWRDIATKCIKNYPDSELEILKFFVPHFGKRQTLFESTHTEAIRALNQVAEDFPQETWAIVREYIGPPMDSRAFSLLRWFEQIVYQIPPDLIWQWIEIDPEKRAPYIAGYLPSGFHEGEPYCWSREILMRYGENKKVRQNITANIFTESWAGPAQDHFEARKKWLEELRSRETNPNVLKWISECIDFTDQEIQRWKASDERDEF